MAGAAFFRRARPRPSSTTASSATAATSRLATTASMLLLVLAGQATIARATPSYCARRLVGFVGGVGLSNMGQPWPCAVRPFGRFGAAGEAGGGDGGANKKNRKPKPSKGGKGPQGQGRGEETFRLDRLLANRGVGTRTEVTTLVRRGRVKRADTGEVVRDPSLHLPASAVLLVHDEPITPLPILVAYHKPFGVHSTMGDPMGRPNLEDALPPRLQKSFHPVGRLDADTTGLLLFSGDGQLTQRLLHPSGNVQRQYLATVEGQVDEAALRAKLAAGVETADGTYEAELLGFEVPSTVCVGVAEGKHRMVRRMLANAGHGVLTLHRVRYGEVDLGALPEGEIREIAPGSPEGAWAQRLLAAGRPNGEGSGDGTRPPREPREESTG